MTRYEFALEAHSVLRLVLTFLCAWLLGLGLWGVFGKREKKLSGKLALKLVVFAADVQLVLGLLLYCFWSPATQQAFGNFHAAMQDPTLRFFAVEHSTAMLLVVGSVHTGKVLAARAADDAQRYRRLALWFGLALVLILLVSPWPFSSVARPVWPVAH
jgi:hypothetical protein